MNEKINQQMIVGVRFSPIGKNYYFDASKLENLKVGDTLVVETSRGWQLGQLTQFVEPDKVEKNMHYKPVDRVASEADLKKKQYLEKRGEESFLFTRNRLSVKEIDDVKLVSAEFSFDEKSLTFIYSTEHDNNVNFNQIIKEIKNEFKVTKIDFHKIGPRDVAKYYCGMGACGLENRCCSQFIDKFDSISIRMAKTQGISLTPTDITGMCNRLRCCLGYEYCMYVDALKEMPKRKKKVMTPFGAGIIQDIAPISRTVFVAVPEHGVKEFGLDEITDITTSEKPQPNTAQQPPEKTPQENRPPQTGNRFGNRRRPPKRRNNTKNE